MEFKKKYGQNFLRDKNIIKKIVESTKDLNIKNIIEVGPGDGALTEFILKIYENVKIIEIDDDLIPLLENKFSQKNLEIINKDILDIEINKMFKDSYQVIANLPYYISSKIIFKFLKDNNCKALTIMLQKELVDRMTSNNDSKTYGRLTVAVNTFFDTNKILDVNRKLFTPQPDVDSSVIQLERKKEKLIEKENIDSYLNFVKISFAMKRKTIYNNLKKYYKNDVLEKSLHNILGDDYKHKRSENISINDFVKLFDKLN